MLQRVLAYDMINNNSLEFNHNHLKLHTIIALEQKGIKELFHECTWILQSECSST